MCLFLPGEHSSNCLKGDFVKNFVNRVCVVQSQCDDKMIWFEMDVICQKNVLTEEVRMIFAFKQREGMWNFPICIEQM